MKPKLLIVGAGIGQVPMLLIAKKMGVHTTVVTRPGNYPCIPLADDVIYIDIFDKDSIVEEAIRRHITAVVSDQNDLTLPTAAYVAEKLGLPGNSYDTVMSYCDKNKYRNMCEIVGVPVPAHAAACEGNNPITIPRFPFPWMVKPADSQSSIAVQKITDIADLDDALSFAYRSSRTHSAIIEQFLTGKEVVCEGFIHEGRYYLLSFGDRRYFDLTDRFIPNQTLFPSTLDMRYKNEILGYESALAAYTRPSFAIVHSEYIINEETGEVGVVESALRGGGVYISSHLMPLATGIDVNKLVLDCALGKAVDIKGSFEARKHKAAGYVCFYLGEGTIESIEGVEELSSLPFVEMVHMDGLEIGKTTSPMTYKGARKGPILVKGNNRSELEENIRTVQSTLEIRILDNQGVLSGINWE